MIVKSFPKEKEKSHSQQMHTIDFDKDIGIDYKIIPYIYKATNFYRLKSTVITLYMFLGNS